MLICFGGADMHNATFEVLNLLEEKQFSHKCHVVLGDAFLHQQLLDKFIEISKLKINVQKNLSAQEMADLMSDCRYAILQPSTISYEYLSVNTGELYLKMTADNQKDVYSFYVENGIGYDISELFVEDGSRISESKRIQEKYFDGKSDERIKAIFKRFQNEQQLQLRKAQLSDLDLYFHWVNDSDARQNAITVKQIDYDEHCVWFAEKVISKDACLWVMEYEEVPVGQIRFDIDRSLKEATISYFIAQEHRGKGFGLSVVKLGLELFFGTKKDISTINAVVKSTNGYSRKIFEHFSFQINKEENGFLFYKITNHE
jgi:RimJ/RimL family protein N-acetyltransferase